MRRSTPDFTQPATATSDWLTTPEVAALLRVHPKHIYRLLHQGMPARRVGGQWRFSRDAIKRWADQRGESLCGADDAQAPTASAPSFPLVAVEPNEVSDIIVGFLAALPGVRFATVAAPRGQALALLAAGEVAAAILRPSDAATLPCATVRLSLGSRPLGLLTRSGEDALKRGQRLVLPPSPLDSLVASLQKRAGVAFRQADSELEACSLVLRQQANAALGSKAWARRLGLDFQLLASEAWEIAFRIDAMTSPNVSRLCAFAQGDALRDRLLEVLEDAAEWAGQMRLEHGTTSDALLLPEDAPQPGKPAERDRKIVRWTLLERDRADQMLNLAKELRECGVRVGGFVQVPSGPASSKPLGYDLYRLSQPERRPLAERFPSDKSPATGARSCELTFHPETLARAQDWLREDIPGSDLLIVDGVGPLEERGQGLFPALAWAREQARPRVIVLSSRREHVPRIADRLSLPDRLITRLSLEGHSAASEVLAHLLYACGRKRRSRTKAPVAERTRC